MYCVILFCCICLTLIVIITITIAIIIIIIIIERATGHHMTTACNFVYQK